MSASVTLCQARPRYLAHGVPLLVAFWVAVVAYGVRATELFTPLLAAGVAVMATAAVLVLPHWFVSVARLFNMSVVGDVSRATHVMVRPRPHKGSAGFAPLHRTDDGGTGVVVSFEYQQRRMVWDGAARAFVKIGYPVAMEFGAIKAAARGVGEDLDERTKRWGRNSVELTLPTFRDLYIEHALAPFFVFQMFFVLLWCLDEYWMYAILTGAMLAFMEAITVFRRLNIIRSLRGMVQKPGRVFVLRSRKWVELDGQDIVPGDVIEIGAAKKRDETFIPCDAILLSGACVVNEATLTGENVALLKDNVEQRADAERYDMKADRVHTLFGGTRLLQCSGGASGNARVRTPNGGCAAMAVRTGFASSQGKVLRTIAFASQTMSANSVEAFLFILFLLAFALVAAGHVLQHGLLDPAKSRYKLLLECIIILTSVVPPELPIELALAVNTSLQALRMLRIFCTEPFRIPFAGKLDICAFDKTGTLTRDELLFRGVACSSDTAGDALDLSGPDTAARLAADETLLVVAGCQSLSRIDGAIVGDPLEAAALDGLGWTLRSDKEAQHDKRRLRTEVVVRFHFSAALRRMTTVVLASAGGKAAYRVCVKGAPEAVQQLLRAEDRATARVQHGYERYATQGYRVLALATKVIQVDSVDALAATPRAELETDLCFAGFLVFECPLRDGTSAVLHDLQDAAIRTIMITGDSELTACAVTQQTGMSKLPALICAVDAVTGDAQWSNGSRAVDAAAVRALAATHTLCVTGAALDRLAPVRADFFPAITVWARCSPAHKEQVMVALRNCGYHTLMCGDGTNDVGALKQSHVGVALVYTSAATLAQADVRQQQQRVAPVRDPFVKRKEDKKAAVAAAGPAGGEARVGFVERFLAMLREQDKDLSMQMGDASIAAPFTVRAANVAPVLDVLRQGRCTLVTTLQMYFILALNGLVTAFSLSVLHLAGVRYGDVQMTTMALVTALAFLFISRAKPLAKLSPIKPAYAIFTPYFFCALLGQFAVHLACLLAASHYAMAAVPGGFVAPPSGDPFAPSVVNSCVFLVSSSMTLTTFAVNYQGHPFMQSLRENSALLKCLAVGYALLLLGCAGVLTLPLQLVHLPAHLKLTVSALMAADLVGCYVWQLLSAAIFTKYNTKRV